MNRTLKNILAIFIILTICFIWGNSVLPADASSCESGFVMRIISPFLEVLAGRGNVTMHMVRKLAHFAEYFVLGIELTLYAHICMGTVRPDKKWQEIIIPLAIGILVASIDETIQIFAIARGPSLKDVLLDFAGVCSAVITVRLILMLSHSRS